MAEKSIAEIQKLQNPNKKDKNIPTYPLKILQLSTADIFCKNGQSTLCLSGLIAISLCINSKIINWNMLS